MNDNKQKTEQDVRKEGVETNKKQNKLTSLIYGVDSSIKENISTWVGLLLFVVVTLAGFVVKGNIDSRKHLNNRPQYVTINTNHITNNFIKTIVNSNLTDGEYKDILLKYDTALKETIANVSKENNLIIIKKDAVYTEIPDITPQVEKVVFEKLDFDGLLGEEV